MKQLGKFKLYSSEEVLEEAFGPIGTPQRDEFEAEVAEAVRAYELGEAVKKARLLQNLTQAQLGERIGVKKAQISKIENGHSVSLPTIGRVFRALGVPTASLDFGADIGKIALW